MQEREFEELLWKARNKDKKAVFEIKCTVLCC